MTRRTLLLVMSTIFIITFSMSSVAFAAATEVAPADAALIDKLPVNETPAEVAAAEIDQITEQYATEDNGSPKALPAANYNAKDVAAVRAFLKQPSRVYGKTNANIMNWDINDPGTWGKSGTYLDYARWNEEGLLIGLGMQSKNLAGTLDVRDCVYLSELFADADVVDFTGCNWIAMGSITACEIRGRIFDKEVHYISEKAPIFLYIDMDRSVTSMVWEVSVSAPPDQTLYPVIGWFDGQKFVSEERKLYVADIKNKTVIYSSLQLRSTMPRPVLVKSISLKPNKTVIGVGKNVRIAPTILPGNADNKSLKWSSSNTSIAKVSSSGIVTGVGVGTARIIATAKDGSKKNGSAIVTVKKGMKLVTDIKLSKSELSLSRGKAATLIATVSPSNATNKALIWKSSNSRIAKVDQTGKVTAVSNGTATITATATDGSSRKKTAEVRVF